jgi:thiosulfate/3-mercaptopyruvate sulfurtransferase
MKRPDDPIVDAAWLLARKAAPDVRIIDASWAMPGATVDMRAEHARSRIPGSVFFDIDEIADTASPLPHMLPSPEKFASRLRRLGLGDGVRFVVYDRDGMVAAARVWWTARAMGKEDVVVLDGGLPAWIAAGGQIEDGPPLKPPERHFTARFRQDLVRTLDEMRAIIADGRANVLDARPAARFLGEVDEPRPGLRRGHMPGAANIPWTTLVGPDGRLKDADGLRAVLGGFAAAPKPVVATCGSGVSAAMIVLAMARLGRWDVSLYDGSWAQWGGREDTPVVTGP